MVSLPTLPKAKYLSSKPLYYIVERLLTQYTSIMYRFNQLDKEVLLHTPWYFITSQKTTHQCVFSDGFVRLLALKAPPAWFVAGVSTCPVCGWGQVLGASNIYFYVETHCGSVCSGTVLLFVVNADDIVLMFLLCCLLHSFCLSSSVSSLSFFLRIYLFSFLSSSSTYSPPSLSIYSSLLRIIYFFSTFFLNKILIPSFLIKYLFSSTFLIK